MIETNLKPRSYDPGEVCRIVNPRQQTLYIKNGVFPIDLYTSLDKHGKNIVVMIFLREDSKQVYQDWINYELK